jgi:hypothetical protein
MKLNANLLVYLESMISVMMSLAEYVFFNFFSFDEDEKTSRPTYRYRYWSQTYKQQADGGKNRHAVM